MVTKEQPPDTELVSKDVPEITAQPSDVETSKEANNEEDGVPQKKKKFRRRKRALHASILSLMEFYFSDSNLTKDRFLAELVKTNPDVPIETFMKFNKLRSLTTETSTIARALEKSSMLQVSEDETTVRRITPIVLKNNVDDCTVYVQRLPPDADHEWLTTQFSKYGKITYVSIPKFSQTNKIKGFAFVEFDTPEEVEKCLTDFKARGCELPSGTPPENMLSITTFQEQGKQKQSNSIIDPNDQKVSNKSLDSDESKSKKKKKKKNKHNHEDSGTDQSESLNTKVKTENDRKSDISLDNSNVEKQEKKNKKKKREEIQETDDLDHVQAKRKKDDKEIDFNNEGEKRKRKRKITQEEHESSETEQSESTKTKIKKECDENSDTFNADTSVGEEKRSKKRKNRHSNEEVSLSDIESQKTSDENKNKHKKVKTDESEVSAVESDVNEAAEIENDKEVEESEKKKKRKKRNRNYDAVPHVIEEYPFVGMQVMAKKDWKRLRNKYLDLQRAKMKQLKQHLRKVKWNQWGDKNKMETNVEETENVNPASKLDFSPGLIVKVELNEPCVDSRGFKTELKSNNTSIKYIDIKDGSSIAYIRCDSVEAATALSKNSSQDNNFQLLAGEEETLYWEQIKKDRDEKRSSNLRQKVRGRKKLLKKAEKELGKHIKFDD